MKNKSFFLSTALFIFAILFTAYPAYGRYQPEQADKGLGFEQPIYREGEVIVKFKKDVAAMTAGSIASSYVMRPVREFKILSRRKGQPYLLLKSDRLTTQQMISVLENDPGVESVSPNYIRRICAIPNDHSFDQLWGLNNTGQTVNGISGTLDADIDAPETWDISTGSADVVVAVVDTGVDYTHQDLAGNMWVNPAPDTFSDSVSHLYTDDTYGINAFAGTGDPMDDNGHGTHISGTVGAVGNNGLGITGVNWTAGIMACKFLDADGYGTDADAITCIEYAVDRKTNHGVNVVAINASWGGGGGANNDPLYEVISAAGNAGIIFVAAAGNSASNNDTTPFYPASYNLPNIISVAATNQNDNLASFSNYGPKSVDLGAPGANILSTLPGGGYIPPAIGDLFFDDMESGGGNWTTGGISNNSWAITAEKSYSPDYAWSDSPGPPPNKNYLDDTNSYLEVKNNIDLSETAGQDIRLGFRAFVALEDGYDLLFVELSKDGGATWGAISSLTGQNPVWHVYAYYIPSAYRTAQFRFRFHLSTDDTNRYDGVYIDDVGVGVSVGSDNYDYDNGTSMSAPHVTGAVALLSAKYPTEGVSDRINRILAGVDQLSSLSNKTVTGGRLNLFNAISPPLPPYLIIASAGSGGTISPSGQVYVPSGTDKTFTIIPNSGYHLASLLVDGTPVDTGNGTIVSYIFEPVIANHTIVATFEANPAASSGGGGGGGVAVGPLAVGLSALLGWWKRRRSVVAELARRG